ncbi:glycosyltransferase family 2 protein [Gluconobacter sp. Dm-62]|uniref:glycosyltransferase family 2 protein n=1 Tax=Gluconobacter sp. Dm-62 TaxID=2799804 RepID=UPI001B8CC229|nr:glycosyltransferase family 2 protein [Gluconobacter sp. Dm-62]MBS1102422.1 glycosyltransferase family 2 protein [Gluconobacter sp. Dm-62]
MTQIRCVMMQKNEATLLEPWVLWHAAIFGFSNLTVIDNGSTDPAVLDIQTRYEKKGVRIVRNHASHNDFLHKGDVIAGIIRQWDAENACDFAVPLDCDEFLTVFLDQLSLDPEVIRRQFDYLMQENATFITERLLLNVPEAPDYYRPQIVRRGLFKAQTIVSLDRGFHNPQSIYPNRYVRTPFVYLHLHNRPDYEDIRRFAHQKLAATDTGAQPEHPKDGTHLHYYFNASYQDFLASYSLTPDLYAPMIAQRFRDLGVDPDILLGTGESVPHPPLSIPSGFVAHRARDDGQQHEYRLFDPLYYARSNPDVTQDPYYGIWPLIHYVTLGWDEGRAPAAQDAPPLVLRMDKAT